MVVWITAFIVVLVIISFEGCANGSVYRAAYDEEYARYVEPTPAPHSDEYYEEIREQAREDARIDAAADIAASAAREISRQNADLG